MKQSISKKRHDERTILKEQTDVLIQDHWRLKEEDDLADDSLNLRVDPQKGMLLSKLGGVEK